MRLYFRFLLPALFIFSQTVLGHSSGEHRGRCPAQAGVFQYSTIGALMEKYLDGGMSFQRLSRKGNLGLGTLNGLDGEMIALDGEFFQIKADGKAYQVSNNAQTPFATMIHFSPDKTLKLPKDLSYKSLQQFLMKEANPGNHIQAIRIDGKFKQLTLRSNPKQNHPYRRLSAITQSDMVIFEHKNVEGTLVGFWFPEYMGQLNIPGYHFHFIDKDRKLGGHVLALASEEGNVSIQTTRRFKMILPKDDDFNQLNLNKDHSSDFNAVEKGID